MNPKKLLATACLFSLTLVASPVLAARIYFDGDAVISVTMDQSSSFVGTYNAAEIGNYLGYPHEDKTSLATGTGGSSASITGQDMTAANQYFQGTFNTQGHLQAEVPGFISQFNENRMDLYFAVQGGTYDININVDSWNRTYGWDQTGVGNPLTETGWYSNLYAKLVHEGQILREDNLVLVSVVNTTFTPALSNVTSTGGPDWSLSFANVDLPAGQYTLYVADYMTQYGVDPPAVPLPNTMLLMGSGLLVLVGSKLKPSV